MKIEEFEQIIDKTLESVPEKFRKKIDNLSIVIDEHNIVASQAGKNNASNTITLALYHGVPLIKRAGSRPVFPDKITVYKKAIESVSRTPEDIRKTTRRVLLHELGHYFGLDEKRLRELKY